MRSHFWAGANNTSKLHVQHTDVFSFDRTSSSNQIHGGWEVYLDGFTDAESDIDAQSLHLDDAW